MAKEYKITSLRLQDLEKELNYLKTTREREIAAMIAEARSYGDLSENSEYDAAKNEQAKLYGRIAEIEDILSHAVIIEDENEASGRVGLGCTVVVEDAKGVSLEGVGITPDVVVPVDENTASAIYAGTIEAAADPQIQAAVKALTNAQ